MKTKLIKINKQNVENSNLLEEAGTIIRMGGLVAFPTETVYGLGANALDPEAARKIYQAKGRPSDNPLIIHISQHDDLPQLVKGISSEAEQLMAAYWPGPLTLIFEKKDCVPYETTGGLETVAVRMPDHFAASGLIQCAGVPIAAPSANTSGRPSPTMAEHVYKDLDGKIDMILDGGTVGIGLESTIVDVSGEIPVLLRPGAITVDMIKSISGDLVIDPSILEPMNQKQKPKAPGMKYKHYAPSADLVLIEGEQSAVVAKINTMVKEKQDQGLQVGILCTEETKQLYLAGEVKSIGIRSQPETIASHLFSVLREFDDLKVDLILSESFSSENLGLAIMNRLMKAAGYHVIQVERGEM